MNPLNRQKPCFLKEPDMERVDGDGSKTDEAAASTLRQTLKLSSNFTDQLTLLESVLFEVGQGYNCIERKQVEKVKTSIGGWNNDGRRRRY